MILFTCKHISSDLEAVVHLSAAVTYSSVIKPSMGNAEVHGAKTFGVSSSMLVYESIRMESSFCFSAIEVLKPIRYRDYGIGHIIIGEFAVRAPQEPLEPQKPQKLYVSVLASMDFCRLVRYTTTWPPV
jgi:hypothetical protein